MHLSYPFEIAPNLEPGIKIGSDWLTIAYSDLPGTEHRTRYSLTILFADGSEFSDVSLQSGCGGGDLKQGMESALSFLDACGSAIDYQTRTGRESDCADLFPPHIAEWASNNSDAIQYARCEIEETADCIIE